MLKTLLLALPSAMAFHYLERGKCPHAPGDFKSKVLNIDSGLLKGIWIDLYQDTDEMHGMRC